MAAAGNEEGIQTDEVRFGSIPEKLKLTLASIIKKEIPPQVTLWGSGNPRREFLHVDDLAKACQLLLECDGKILMDASILPKSKDSQALPLINIGCGKDQTIAELAHLTKNEFGFEGDIKWDRSKPDGTPQKLLDVTIIHRLVWRATTPLAQGISQVCRWYRNETGA